MLILIEISPVEEITPKKPRKKKKKQPLKSMRR